MPGPLRTDALNTSDAEAIAAFVAGLRGMLAESDEMYRSYCLHDPWRAVLRIPHQVWWANVTPDLDFEIIEHGPLTEAVRRFRFDRFPALA